MSGGYNDTETETFRVLGPGRYLMIGKVATRAVQHLLQA